MNRASLALVTLAAGITLVALGINTLVDTLDTDRATNAADDVRDGRDVDDTERR